MRSVYEIDPVILALLKDNDVERLVAQAKKGIGSWFFWETEKVESIEEEWGVP